MNNDNDIQFVPGETKSEFMLRYIAGFKAGVSDYNRQLARELSQHMKDTPNPKQDDFDFVEYGKCLIALYEDMLCFLDGSARVWEEYQ